MLIRIWNYLQMMFPLYRTAPACLLSFFVVWATATRISGLELSYHPRLVAGAFSFMLFALLLRVMDEFKDVDVDSRLFRDRPLITGMVTRLDLSVLGWSVVVALFALNVWQGKTILIMFLVCFAYCSLMFKFFFYPKMRDSLLLALVTHNPVIFLFQCYILAYHVHLAPQHVDYSQLAILAALFWFPMLNWEIARKIRAPESEDAYETYSQNFGYRGACIIVSTLTLMIYGGTYWVSTFYENGIVLIVGTGLGAAYALFRYIRFCFAPEKGKAPLKPVVENYILIFYIVFGVAQFL